MDAPLAMKAADQLAAACRLDIVMFGRLYERCCVAKSDCVSWSELVGRTAPVPGQPNEAHAAALRQAACREALKVQLLLELALAIANAQFTLGLSDTAEADQVVMNAAKATQSAGAAGAGGGTGGGGASNNGGGAGAGGGPVTGGGAGGTGGSMHALVAPGALLSRATLDGTLAVDSATAIVYQGTQVVGTAFLATPDMVLTAAHVVLAHDGTAWNKALSDGLSFSFRAQPGAAGSKPVVAYPATSGALVACSLPWGAPPDKLHVLPVNGGSQRLDFALIRLDREVRHVSPLNIESPPKPFARDPLVVLGFPGGTAMGWHAGAVAGVDGERLQHLANALPGMSGSCCINVHGHPMGLHEGSLGSQTFGIGGQKGAAGANRAVCLWVIRNAMGVGAADPLRSRSQPAGLEFFDESLVRRWAKAGLRFAPPGLQDRWRMLVTDAIGQDPEATGAVPAFHPWFKRDTFEAWIDQNVTATNTNQRLCIVTGDPGTGKTFLASILRARVRDPVLDTVLISATETTAWSWRHAIAAWGVSTDPNAGLRPAAGVALHDEVPKAAELVAGHGGRRPPGPVNPLFVAIDFDGKASFSLDDEAPWLPFMETLLAQPWVRLIVIGAPEAVASSLLDVMPDAELDATLRIHLAHIDASTFRDHARRQLRRGRATLPADEIKAAVDYRDRLVSALPEPTLQTAVAVLAAMQLHKGLGG